MLFLVEDDPHGSSGVVLASLRVERVPRLLVGNHVSTT